jgi:hypothetical protein
MNAICQDDRACNGKSLSYRDYPYEIGPQQFSALENTGIVTRQRRGGYQPGAMPHKR